MTELTLYIRNKNSGILNAPFQTKKHTKKGVWIFETATSHCLKQREGRSGE